MSATPPAPSSPLPEDLDDSLDEIDAMTSSREKFKALQKRLSSSNTMYSSPSASLTSGSESPPPAPPPNKIQHVLEGSSTGEDHNDSVFVDDEKEASSRAKKLSHATKNRPKRKVRQPSREKLREQLSTGSFDVDPMEGVQEENVTVPDIPPSLPATPPPPAESPAASPLIKKQLHSSISAPYVTSPSTGQGDSSPSITDSPFAERDTKKIVIGSFKDRIKKIKQDRATKSGSRIAAVKAEELSQVQAEPASSEKSKDAPPMRSPPLGNPSVSDQRADHEAFTPKFEERAASGNTYTGRQFSSNPISGLHDEVSKESFTVEAANVMDDDDDEMPSIPPPPVPDLPPPDVMDLTPPPNDPSPPERAKKIEKNPSFKTIAKRHKAQKEVWKRKSDVLEGIMNKPLPLFIHSKTLERNLASLGQNGSTESLSSLPDSPPPSPPPFLPDSPPPMFPDDSTDVAEEDETPAVPQMVESGGPDIGDSVNVEEADPPLYFNPPHSPEVSTPPRKNAVSDFSQPALSQPSTPSSYHSATPLAPAKAFSPSPPVSASPAVHKMHSPALSGSESPTPHSSSASPQVPEPLTPILHDSTTPPTSKSLSPILPESPSALHTSTPLPVTIPDPSPPISDRSPSAVSRPPHVELLDSTPPTLKKNPSTVSPDSAPPTLPESLPPTIPDLVLPTTAPPTLLEPHPPTPPASGPETPPPTIPNFAPRIPPESFSSTLPETAPPAIPKTFPPDSAPPTFPDSLPPELPDSLPPTLPESPPPALPESSFPSSPSSTGPEPPISPIPNLSSDMDQHSLSLSPSEYIKASTPQSQSANEVESPSLILATTPQSTSTSFDKQPLNASKSSTIPSRNSTAPSWDDLKSTSEPNIEPDTSKDMGVQFRRGKHSHHPVEYRQSFPLTVSAHENVKVISHNSPPASPDLKFTRVSKKTWKKLKNVDDLSSSASTGNVMERSPSPNPDEHPTGSLRSLQSNDSLFERNPLLQKNQTGPLSPLVAVSTSTPVHATKNEVDDQETGFDESALPTVQVTVEEATNDYEEQLKMMGPIKPRQLDAVRRVSGRPMSSNISSFVLDSNILDTEPEKWGLEEVSQWLDLVGFGSFKQAFKEKQVHGHMLLKMDVKLFADLGIDSHEMRELFLAKIYELSNPSSSMGVMEDDFLLSVDTYNSDDWTKLKAAVNVLKTRDPGESVLLEPTHTKNDSNPSLSNMSESELQALPGNFQYDGTRHNGRRASEGEMLAHRSHELLYPASDYEGNQYPSDSGDLTNDWVAGLPPVYGRRARSHTEPIMPPEHILVDDLQLRPLRAFKTTTLPPALSLVPQDKPENSSQASSRLHSRRSSHHQQRVNETSSPTQLSPVHVASRQVSVQSSVMSPTSVTSEQRRDSALQSPTTPLTPSRKLVKIYMSRVQKGSLYKSFIAHPMTTVEDITLQALQKANMNDKDPSCYCITEASNVPNGPCRVLESSQSMAELAARLPKNCHFELRLKSKVPGFEEMPKATVERTEESTVSRPQEPKQMTRQEPSIDHMHMLEHKNREMQKQLDSIQVQLLDHQERKKQLSSLQVTHSELRERFQREQAANKKTVQQLQDQLDEATLARRKMEEQLLLTGSASATGATDTHTLLDDIQKKYSEEIAYLTGEIRVKEKTLQEMRTKRITMEEEINQLQESVKELEKDRRLLNERNQLVHSMDRDLAVKEDMIHKLLAENEQARLLADQAATLQMSLQNMEVKSKQQQELSKKTARELKEHLDRVMLENTQKDQLLQAVKKERDRLIRENQAKDALNTSLEADLDSFNAVQTLSVSDSSRIQKLTRSISVNEVAMASLKGEFDKQNAELLAAEEELKKLRNALAKKDKQLALLTSINDSNSPRSSLYSSLAHQVPHTLITAQILTSERQEGGQGQNDVGIKVNTFPGEVKGCVIIHLEEHVDSLGLLPGDRVLEINDIDVTSMSPREIKDLLQRHYREEEGVKIVVARPVSSEDNDNEGATENVLERYKKLSSSLSVRLESQNTEVEHWRQECNRLKSEILKYSTSQKDKDLEIKYLKSTVQDLKQQVEVAEKSTKQLKETLEELESSVRDQDYPQHTELLEEALKAKDKEVNKIRAAEKARIAELKKLKQERDKAVKTVRQYAINKEDLKDILPRHRTQLDNLTSLSRKEVTNFVHTLEKDLAHHKSYLDQLLTIIIDHHPDLLTIMGEAQKMRDQMEEDDSWC